eukprot:1177547-Prorocentrum_minimum.AAC.5
MVAPLPSMLTPLPSAANPFSSPLTLSPCAVARATQNTNDVTALDASRARLRRCQTLFSDPRLTELLRTWHRACYVYVTALDASRARLRRCQTLFSDPRLTELHERFFEPPSEVMASVADILAGPPVNKLLFACPPDQVCSVLTPITLLVDPLTVHVEPRTVHVEPRTLLVDPLSVHVEPLTVHVDPLTVHVEPLTVHVDPLTVTFTLLDGCSTSCIPCCRCCSHKLCARFGRRRCGVIAAGGGGDGEGELTAGG